MSTKRKGYTPEEKEIINALVEGLLMSTVNDVWIVRIWDENGPKNIDAWYKVDVWYKVDIEFRNIDFDFLLAIKKEGETVSKREAEKYAKDVLLDDALEAIKALHEKR